jgi:hypothetical protein
MDESASRSTSGTTMVGRIRREYEDRHVRLGEGGRHRREEADELEGKIHLEGQPLPVS